MSNAHALPLPPEHGVDAQRRTWLLATSAMGVAATAGVAVPFVSSFAPSERAKAQGARRRRDHEPCQRRAWRSENRAMARPASVGDAPHAGDAGQPGRHHRPGRPGLREAAAARLRHQHPPLDQAESTAICAVDASTASASHALA